MEKKGDYKPTYISISRTLRIDRNEVKTYSTNDKLNGDEPGVIPRWRLSSNTFLLMIFFFFFNQQTSFLPFQFLSLTILAPPLSTCSFTSVRISGSDSSTEKNYPFAILLVCVFGIVRVPILGPSASRLPDPQVTPSVLHILSPSWGASPPAQ